MYALVKDQTHHERGLLLRQALKGLTDSAVIPISTVVTVTMASGHGVRVNELDDRTERGGAVSVTLGELLEVVDSTEEWFDELRATIGNKLAFGLIDSSAVFVEGDRDVVTAAVRGFLRVSFHDGHFLLTV